MGLMGYRTPNIDRIAAEAAALSVWRVTSLGDRVEAVVFSENDVVEIRLRARDGAVMQILDAIVRQNRMLKATDGCVADPGLFNEALRRAARLANHDFLVCPITDAFGADEETVELVTKITAHNDALTVFIHHPLEAQLPDIGRAVVAEADRQLEIDTSARDLRTRFAVDFSTRREKIEALSRKRTIPILPISTAEDVLGQFWESFGAPIGKSADMTSDPADLSNLRDIVLPPSISFWPPAPGWWTSLGVACSGTDHARKGIGALQTECLSARSTARTRRDRACLGRGLGATHIGSAEASCARCFSSRGRRPFERTGLARLSRSDGRDECFHQRTSPHASHHYPSDLVCGILLGSAIALPLSWHLLN